MWKCSPEAQVRLRTLIAGIILRMGSGPDKIDPPPLLTAWCTAGARAPVASLSRNGVRGDHRRRRVVQLKRIEPDFGLVLLSLGTRVETKCIALLIDRRNTSQPESRAAAGFGGFERANYARADQCRGAEFPSHAGVLWGW